MNIACIDNWNYNLDLLLIEYFPVFRVFQQPPCRRTRTWWWPVAFVRGGRGVCVRARVCQGVNATMHQEKRRKRGQTVHRISLGTRYSSARNKLSGCPNMNGDVRPLRLT